jgi:hypothetical protein
LNGFLEGQRLHGESANPLPTPPTREGPSHIVKR